MSKSAILMLVAFERLASGSEIAGDWQIQASHRHQRLDKSVALWDGCSDLDVRAASVGVE